MLRFHEKLAHMPYGSIHASRTLYLFHHCIIQSTSKCTILVTCHFVMQSPPYETKMSQDLLEDSECLETAGHPLDESQMTEADGVSPDLLHESQYAVNAWHDDQIDETQLTEVKGLSPVQLHDGEAAVNASVGKPVGNITPVQETESVSLTDASMLQSHSSCFCLKVIIMMRESDAYLNGKIIAIPRKGNSQYQIIWYTSSLPHLVLDESQLRCFIPHKDKEMVSRLKRSHLLYDEVYPDGPTRGVLSVFCQ